jgi:hypothetical protein
VFIYNYTIEKNNIFKVSVIWNEMEIKQAGEVGDGDERIQIAKQNAQKWKWNE